MRPAYWTRRPLKATGATADRGKPAFLPGSCVIPAGRVDVGARGEQGTEQGDLLFGRRPSMHRSRRSFEEPRLRRTRRCGLPPGQFQQSQQAGILGPQAQQLCGHLGPNRIAGITPSHSGHRMAHWTFPRGVRGEHTVRKVRQLLQRNELPPKEISLFLYRGVARGSSTTMLQGRAKWP